MNTVQIDDNALKRLIPNHTPTQNTKRYGVRKFDFGTVKKVYDDGFEIQLINGMSTYCQIGANRPPRLGAIALIGMDGFNMVGMVYADGIMYRDYDDASYDRDEANFKTEREAQAKESEPLAAARQSYLSSAVQERINYFHENNSGDWDGSAWLYEVTIGEIVDMLVASDLEETPDIKEYYSSHGVSGNQVDCAHALAKRVIAGESIAGTIGGLSPITGKAFY